MLTNQHATFVLCDYTDNPVLLYAYLLRHPHICQGTIQVFGVPLPAFSDGFFLPLSQADNLSGSM